MLDQAIHGEEATYVEAQPLIMESSGYPAETYCTFSHSPILADDGSAGGIICANSDGTKRVIGERQLPSCANLGARTAEARTWADTCRAIETALASDRQDMTFADLSAFDDESHGFELAAFTAELGLAFLIGCRPFVQGIMSAQEMGLAVGEQLAGAIGTSAAKTAKSRLWIGNKPNGSGANSLDRGNR